MELWLLTYLFSRQRISFRLTGTLNVHQQFYAALNHNYEYAATATLQLLYKFYC